jgi:predicted outer membrane repeat protein
LHKALNNAISGDQIWIAQGIYKPTNTADRNISFDLQAGKDLSIYGGFAGGENDLSTRNIKDHVVILSGDIGIPASTGDNSFHVLRVVSNGSTKIIDGVEIRDGFADGAGQDSYGAGFSESNGAANSKIEFRNCLFENNAAGLGGGAVYSNLGNTKFNFVNTTFYNNAAISSSNGGALWHNHADSLVISHSKFYGNSAPSLGGAIYSTNASPLIVLNSIFSGNNSGNNGGALFTSGANLQLNHNTFSENSSTSGRGGAIYYDNLATSNNIQNSIFWRNSDAFFTPLEGNSDIFSNIGPLNFSNSIVEGSFTAFWSWNSYFIKSFICRFCRT